MTFCRSSRACCTAASSSARAASGHAAITAKTSQRPIRAPSGRHSSEKPQLRSGLELRCGRVGSWSEDAMALQSINPANDELLREYAETEPADVGRILADADRAFQSWRTTSFAARRERMKRAGALLRERKDELARLMAIEMGKP